MADISMDQIKELRDRTGISVMQCKKALEEAGGDIEKALIILRKQSGRAAEKKQDRELNAGVIQAYIHSNREVAAMVELSCETDFVAKNPDFVSLAYDIAMHAAAANPEFISRSEITEEALAKAREVFAGETEGKPAEIAEKIIAGKIDAYLSERVLLEQPFVKDQERTIQNLLEEGTQKFGEKIALSKFVRFSVR